MSQVELQLTGISLLSPHCGRLRLADIRGHAFFTGTDWERLRKGERPPFHCMLIIQGGLSPPENVLAPLPLDLVSYNDSLLDSRLSSSHDEFQKEPTFDHLFHTHPQVSDVSTSDATEIALVDTTTKWIGWSWLPPRHVFSHAGPLDDPSTPQKTFTLTPHTPEAAHWPGGAGNSPFSVPRTATRSRPQSKRQDFDEMLQCVQRSVKKRLAHNVSSFASLEPSVPLSDATPPVPVLVRGPHTSPAGLTVAEMQTWYEGHEANLEVRRSLPATLTYSDWMLNLGTYWHALRAKVHEAQLVTMYAIPTCRSTLHLSSHDSSITALTITARAQLVYPRLPAEA